MKKWEKETLDAIAQEIREVKLDGVPELSPEVLARIKKMQEDFFSSETPPTGPPQGGPENLPK